MTDEAFNEKADLIVQIMNIGGTITPNGQPLITAEEMQQGIIDVLDDNGDLSLVENMFKTYEEYQTQIAAMKNKINANEQQNIIDNANTQSENLMNQMQQGVEDMYQERKLAQKQQDDQAIDNALANLGL